MRLIFFFLSLLIFRVAAGQSEKSHIIEQRIEFITETLEEENPDLTTLFDDLNYYYDHPLNLNSSSAEDLQDLMLLTDLQVHSLLDHIHRNGKLISIYELQSVANFDLPAIYNILPFVMVTDRLQSLHISFDQLFREGSHEFFYRHSRVLEKQKGYTSDTLSARHYPGTQDKIYTRYRFRFGKYISAGITGEKDPGEQFFAGAQRQGFDFYSAHFFMRDVGMIKTAVAGDYQLSFGQGLTFATGISLGKGIAIKRAGSALRPYNSAGENEMLRGAAAVFRMKNFHVTTFYSSKRIDGNIAENDPAGNGEITVSSLQTSGIHATASQLEDKDAIRLTQYGAHLCYITGKNNLGITAVSNSFNGTLQKKTSIYNQFDFTGNAASVAGIDFSHIRKNMNFFSEAAVSHNKGYAFLAGVIVAADPRFSLSLLYRNYQKEFQNLNANAFSENTSPQNEKGFYAGVEAYLKKGLLFTGYFDSFTSDWLKFQVSAPSRGNEFFAQLTWRLSKKTEMYWRFRERNKMRNTATEEGIPFPENYRQINLRYQIQVKAEEKFIFRTRFEAVKLLTGEEDKEEEYGYMICQDFIYRPLLSKISLVVRYAIFDTDSYYTRIYAYENDVLNYFSIPAYSNRGTRFYCILRYKVHRSVDLWIRYGQYLYNNVPAIGSGPDLINGNRKSEIRIQVRMRI